MPRTRGMQSVGNHWLELAFLGPILALSGAEVGLAQLGSQF